VTAIQSGRVQVVVTLVRTCSATSKSWRRYSHALFTTSIILDWQTSS